MQKNSDDDVAIKVTWPEIAAMLFMACVLAWAGYCLIAPVIAMPEV